MPHKFFELHAIKTYTHRILAELYIYNINRQIHFVNAWIHTEVIVNIYMQHIQSIPIIIKTVINHTYDKSIKINK
jgi:hypothetical protein